MDVSDGVAVRRSNNGDARRSSQRWRSGVGSSSATERDPDVVDPSRVLHLLHLSGPSVPAHLFQCRCQCFLSGATPATCLSQHSTTGCRLRPGESLTLSSFRQIEQGGVRRSPPPISTGTGCRMPSSCICVLSSGTTDNHLATSLASPTTRPADSWVGPPCDSCACDQSLVASASPCDPRSFSAKMTTVS